MDHACDWRPATGPHIGRSPGDRPSRGEASKQWRSDIGGTLCEQLRIGSVRAAHHPICDNGGQERFNPGKKA